MMIIIFGMGYCFLVLMTNISASMACALSFPQMTSGKSCANGVAVANIQVHPWTNGRKR